MEKINDNSEYIREPEVLNEIIDTAIEEVVETFGSDMTERDRHMLLAVAGEKSTSPEGKVVYLFQITKSVGVSAELQNYVDQVKQTLVQKFTPAERAIFKSPFEQNDILT